MMDQTKKIPVKTKKNVSLKAKVYNLEGKELRALSLTNDIFQVDVSPKLIAQAIRVYLVNQRQGTAAVKTRAQVVGSTRKIYRQKGTGRARHGSIKAPIFVGGGIVFGPTPRQYSLKINQKQRRHALLGSLSQQAKSGNVVFLSQDSLVIKPKTKIIVKFLQSLGFERKRVLFVLTKLEKNSLVLSARNISNVDFIQVKDINPYQVLKAQKLILLEDSLGELEKLVKKSYAN